MPTKVRFIDKFVLCHAHYHNEKVPLMPIKVSLINLCFVFNLFNMAAKREIHIWRIDVIKDKKHAKSFLFRICGTQ